MADQQPINSLDRFRKRSDRLVLEAHGHCEVPAGCGGVVLRWRDPRAAVPLQLRVYTPAPAAVLIDGVEPPCARIDVAPGPHVLAVTMEAADRAAGLVMFLAWHDPKKYGRTGGPAVTEQPFTLASADDGTWKYALAPPARADWAAGAFDDGAWPALVRAARPNLEWRDFGRDEGAECLGLPRGAAAGTGPVWVRKRFTVPAPEAAR